MRSIACALFVSVAVVQQARASFDVFFRATPASNWDLRSFVLTLPGDRVRDIIIDDTLSGEYWIRSDNPTQDVIRRIIIEDATSGQDVRVIVSSSNVGFVPAIAQPAGAKEWTEGFQFRNGGVPQVSVQAHLVDRIGPFSAYRVGRVSADRIEGISNTNTGGPGSDFNVIAVEAVVIDGGVVSETSNIQLIRCNELTGSVEAKQSGSIGNVEVIPDLASGFDGRLLGTVMAGGSITRVECGVFGGENGSGGVIQAGAGIVVVECGGDFGVTSVAGSSAWEFVPATIEYGLGQLQELDVGGDFNANIEGDSNLGLTTIAGSVYNKLGDASAPETPATWTIGTEVGDPSAFLLNITIDGDLHANVSGSRTGLFAVGADLTGSLELYDGLNSNPLVGQVVVGGSLTSGSEIIIANDPTDPFDFGLIGQVIINEADTGGAWGGQVRLTGDAPANDVVLTSPTYPDLPSTIGGGSVGLVPFSIHREACSPAEGATYDAAVGGPLTEAVVRMYGPVEAAPGAGAGDLFSVECRAASSDDEDDYVDVSSMFETVIDPSGTDPNVVEVRPISMAFFEPGVNYRLTPTASLLSDVATSPSADTTRPLSFTVVVIQGGMQYCPVADVTTDGTTNGVPDGVVTLSDFSFYLNLWSAGSPAADITMFDVCETHSGTTDGVVTLADFSCFLANWSGAGPCQ
ncbi:MAG: GC-type dockerin domain-anchored protein [Planctomycetota bacterium]